MFVRVLMQPYTSDKKREIYEIYETNLDGPRMELERIERSPYAPLVFDAIRNIKLALNKQNSDWFPSDKSSEVLCHYSRNDPKKFVGYTLD